MKNKHKLALGILGAIFLAGFLGMFVLSYPATSALSVNSNNQGISNQSNGTVGEQFDTNGQSSGASDRNNGPTPNPEVKTKDCPTCGGKGTVARKVILTCEYCHGTGIDPNSLKANPVKCRICDGTKKVDIGVTLDDPCPTCNGAKQVPA